jgi:hypothetical protein
MAREKSLDCLAVFEIRPIRMSFSTLILWAILIVLPHVVLAEPRGMSTTPFWRFAKHSSMKSTINRWWDSAS